MPPAAPPPDPTPADLPTWKSKQAANNVITKDARGKSTHLSIACQFCGEPEFYTGPPGTPFLSQLRNGITCGQRPNAKFCGRTLSIQQTGTLVFVQSGGPPRAAYNFPTMQTSGVSVSVNTKAGK